jgi:hypothetical protein
MDSALAKGTVHVDAQWRSRTREQSFEELADLLEEVAAPLIGDRRLQPREVSVSVDRIGDLVRRRLRPFGLRRIAPPPSLGRPNARTIYLEFWWSDVLPIDPESGEAKRAEPHTHRLSWGLVSADRRRFTLDIRECSYFIAARAYERLLVRSQATAAANASPSERLGGALLSTMGFFPLLALAGMSEVVLIPVHDGLLLCEPATSRYPTCVGQCLRFERGAVHRDPAALAPFLETGDSVTFLSGRTFLDKDMLADERDWVFRALSAFADLYADLVHDARYGLFDRSPPVLLRGVDPGEVEAGRATLAGIVADPRYRRATAKR